MTAYRHSHTGLCVADLERSTRFYCEGLGFEVGTAFHLTRPISEVDAPCDLHVRFLHLGPFRLELLAFATPAPFGAPSSRRNQLGVTHLSFLVDTTDLDPLARRLESLGGTILAETRRGAEDPAGEQLVFVADPDGTRVELQYFPPGHPFGG